MLNVSRYWCLECFMQESTLFRDILTPTLLAFALYLVASHGICNFYLARLFFIRSLGEIKATAYDGNLAGNHGLVDCVK